VIVFILAGIYSYLAFSHIDIEDALSLKYFAENFLYYTIILIIMTVIIFVTTVLKSKNIYKELDKVVELSRQGKYCSGDQLKKLGKLGSKIIDINSQLNSLNEMKSLKISSLSNTVNFMLDKSNLSVLVLDAQGLISKVSRQLLEDLQIEDRDILNKFAENILNNFNYSNVINELKKSKYVILKSPLIIETSDIKNNVNVVIFPIFNYRNDISNCACVLVSEETSQQLAQRKSSIAIQQGSKKIQTEVQDLPLCKKFTDLFR
jgi:transcriptional regulator with PAS, ATPase and Fis domain